MKMIKQAKKLPVTTSAASESDSDSNASEDSFPDDGFMSDADYPMSDDGDGGSDVEAAEHETNSQEGPTKWAKTMAKFLRKSADQKILSKALTDAEKADRKAKAQKYKFEIVDAEGSVVKAEAGADDSKPNDLKLAEEMLRQRALLRKEHRKDILGLRLRPSIADFDRERSLRKVATRGTVQLFNAVRMQQREVRQKLEDAGKLEYKREKVLKSLNKKEFLNALMNGPRAKSELVDNLVKKEEEAELKSEIDSDDEPKSTWGALRADFLSGKRSGWDKEDDEEEAKDPDGLDDEMGSDSD